jgi:formate hydrogenlyase subunit 3/multisubunit Na+/H+ antiporter MnhD subunit
MTVLIPVLFAGCAMLIPKQRTKAVARAGIAGTGVNFLFVLIGFAGKFAFEREWAYWEMNFSLKTSLLSSAILTSFAVLAFAYEIFKLRAPGKRSRSLTALSLLTLAMVNGAVLADNLVAMLFFWQAMWLPLYVMILMGGDNAYRTSFKAIVTMAVTDLSLMFGIGLAGYLAKTMAMSEMQVPAGGMATCALALMVLGAIGKLGVFPFHGWRYRALTDAPNAFLTLIPGAADILLGGYLLIRLNGMFPFAGDTLIDEVVAALGILSMLLSILGLAKRRSPSDIAAFVGGAVSALWLFAGDGLLAGFVILGAAASSVSYALLNAQAAEPKFDPYGGAEVAVRTFSFASLKVNDFISRVYDEWIPKLVSFFSWVVRRAHNGSQSRYVVWVLAGAVITALIYRFS